MIDAYFPPAADIKNVLVCFFILLLLCHVFFVWCRNLSKRAWKIVDYLWLAVAAIGLVGASANIRVYVAHKSLESSEVRIANYYGLFRYILETNARDNGYVCRVFERGEYSPPEPEFSNAQKEFDRVCAWLKQKEKTMPKIFALDGGGSDELGEISPMTTNVSLIDVLDGLEDQYSHYLEAKDIYKKLESEAKPTEIEISFSFLAPWLLAFALAIRIAKVSGELRHERRVG